MTSGELTSPVSSSCSSSNEASTTLGCSKSTVCRELRFGSSGAAGVASEIAGSMISRMSLYDGRLTVCSQTEAPAPLIGASLADPSVIERSGTSSDSKLSCSVASFRNCAPRSSASIDKPDSRDTCNRRLALLDRGRAVTSGTTGVLCARRCLLSVMARTDSRDVPTPSAVKGPKPAGHSSRLALLMQSACAVVRARWRVELLCV